MVKLRIDLTKEDVDKNRILVRRNLDRTISTRMVETIESTFCKKYRHQVGNCIALKAELRKRGYRIANNTNGFGNGSNGGQRNGGQPNRGGSNNRGGRNGFQNRSGGRSGFQERMNCMNEEDCDEDYDNDMNDEELFMCCVSEFQENTGLGVVPYEESN